MWFRLCLALGYPHPRILQREISSLDFAEWLAYQELEPFGEERADLRAGIISATVANTARDPKKRRKPFRPAEFMPEFGPKKEQSWQDQLSIVEMLNAAFGGEDKRNGKE